MPQGQTLASFAAGLLPPKPTGPAPVLPQTLGKRPKPMTLAEVIKAAILGGGMGMPSPYEQDYGYERAAAAGEGLSLGLPLMAGALSKGGQTLSQVVKQGIKAYHGSPHDFDQFSLSKIGTGEGAQAYGHGLYFAENPGVAEDYRKQLTQHGNYNLYVNGKQTSFRDAALQAFGEKTGNELASYFENGDALRRAEMKKAQTLVGLKQKLTEQGHQVDLKPVGGTYEVSLNASPDDFLDWDKPLSQQSEKAQAAMRKLLKEHGGSDRYIAEKFGDDPDGQKIYRELNIGGDTLSQKLKDLGVKGIRYLDQGSRIGMFKNMKSEVTHTPSTRADVKGDWTARFTAADGTSIDAQRFGSKADAEAWVNQQRGGTSNYVVFDDAIIDIMKKYGLAFPAAAAMLEQQRQNNKRGQAHASAQ